MSLIVKKLEFSTINTVGLASYVFNEVLYFTAGALRNVINNLAKKLTLMKKICTAF